MGKMERTWEKAKDGTGMFLILALVGSILCTVAVIWQLSSQLAGPELWLKSARGLCLPSEDVQVRIWSAGIVDCDYYRHEATVYEVHASDGGTSSAVTDDQLGNRVKIALSGSFIFTISIMGSLVTFYSYWLEGEEGAMDSSYACALTSAAVSAFVLFVLNCVYTDQLLSFEPKTSSIEVFPTGYNITGNDAVLERIKASEQAMDAYMIPVRHLLNIALVCALPLLLYIAAVVFSALCSCMSGWCMATCSEDEKPGRGRRSSGASTKARSRGDSSDSEDSEDRSRRKRRERRKQERRGRSPSRKASYASPTAKPAYWAGSGAYFSSSGTSDFSGGGFSGGCDGGGGGCGGC